MCCWETNAPNQVGEWKSKPSTHAPEKICGLIPPAYGTTKLAVERKETKRRLDSEDNEVKGAPSPTIKAAYTKKQETYALILSIAEKQTAKGSRVSSSHMESSMRAW